MILIAVEMMHAVAAHVQNMVVLITIPQMDANVMICVRKIAVMITKRFVVGIHMIVLE
jgi:hypothetical protein